MAMSRPRGRGGCESPVLSAARGGEYAGRTSVSGKLKGSATVGYAVRGAPISDG